MVGSEGGYFRRDRRWEKHHHKERSLSKRGVKKPSAALEELRQLGVENQLTYRAWCKWAASLQDAQRYLPSKIYQHRLENYVYPAIGEVPLQTLDCFMLFELISEWQQNRVDYCQMEELICLLSRTLDYAVRFELISKNPCEKSLGKMMRIKMEAFSLSEQAALEERARDSFGKAAVVTLHTGMQTEKTAALS